MPYANKGEWNPALKGIKPPLTNAQANLIAAWADGIAKTNASGAWPIAIARFKKQYTVRGGHWVERKPKAAREASPAQGVPMGDQNIGEAKKMVGGKAFPATDFLVCEDPAKPTTWHLQVKRDGKPDRRLMGAAWASLHGGYRGETYDGPNKSQAIGKLKALYRAEDLEMPAAEADVDVEEYYDPSLSVSPTYGATSFADLDAAENAQDAAQEVRRRTWQFDTIIGNIMADNTIEDKAAAIETAATEFVGIVRETLANPTEERLKEGERAFGESESGQAVALVEAAADAPLVPMALKVQIVKPGKGNAKDKNFYPADVVQRDAHIFEGVKMYETDHREHERSNRTWVSTVDKILEFDPVSGAPIARVVVHDPNFAERARALAAAGKLDNLECSILGAGLAHAQKIDGEEWNVLEQFTRAKAVDWVTKAGAGGHATAIAEGDTMSDPQNPAAAPTTPATPAKPVAEVQTPPPTTPAAQPVAVAETAPAAPVVLAEADVKRLVEATNLPQAARERLLAEHYADEKALREAIVREVEYVKKLTGSGQPFGLGGTPGGTAPTRLSEAEYDKEMKELFARYDILLR